MFGAAILLPLIGLLIALAIQIGEGIYDIFTGVAQEFIEFPQGAFIGAISGAKMAHAMAPMAMRPSSSDMLTPMMKTDMAGMVFVPGIGIIMKTPMVNMIIASAE